MIEVKRLKNLIGRGVAIECPNGLVKKFKVLAVKTTLDKDGERLDLVKLDVPDGLLNSFWRSPVTNKDLKDGAWVYPVFLYRNKGECARQRFEEKLNQAFDAEERWREKTLSLEKELDSYKKLLQKAFDEREELEDVYRKCKFKLGFLKRKPKFAKAAAES